MFKRPHVWHLSHRSQGIDPRQRHPLVGPARLRKQHFKCTVVSELQTQAALPVPYSSKFPLTETVYIDHDHLVASTAP